MLIRP